jgi:uncharacterized protein YprB with RNaseH-like and TPR domain
MPEESKISARDGKQPASPGSIFEGEEVGEGDERCLLYRHRYPKDYVFGRMMPVGDLLGDTEAAGEMNIVKGSPLASREKLLFLDTETTGLAMGTGTYAFLVGIGYFEDGGFRVDQYFMRDFDEEEILLTLLEEAVAPFHQLVTYNGRTFDLQLLRNRYLMAGVMPPFDSKPDLDLLFLSRRFFKGRLDDCRLTTVEKGVLGFHREGDIDGSLIPELYFRYLRTGRFPELDRVLQHNAWDVLSLAYLTHIFSRSLHDPFEASTLHRGAFLRIGKYLEEAGYSSGDTVERCYREAMKVGLDDIEGYEAAKRMSLYFRRQRDYTRASEIWRMMVDSELRRETFPYVELAKHCEHRVKDYSQAIDYVNRAMVILEAGDHHHSPYWVSRERAELRHRLSRLERRLREE